MDFSYYELAFQQATPWPLSDTDSQLAAYHYLSSQIAPPDAAAPGLYDYRSYYPGSLLFDIVTNPTDPTQVPAVASFDDPVLGETVAIDPADFSAVAAQLKAEQAALRSVYSLFLASGEASYASVFSAADGAVPLALVGAAAAVQASTLQPTPATTSTINVSNILNMAAGVASIVGVVAPEMGVVSGLLWVASGVLADNPYGDGGAPAIPNPDYGFMTTVSALATGSEQLETNLSTAFGQSLDNILSDWGKLSAAEQHAATDWLAPNQTSLDPVKAAIQQATTQSFYLQLAPRYYQLDTYLGSGVNQILVYSATQSGCWNTYADYPPPAGAYNSFYNGWFNTDILVFSSGRYGISSLGEPTVSYPSGEGAVLDTLFNTLGVSSRELLSVNGPFQRNLGGTVAAAGPNYQLVWSCFGG
jgi:hypothetical protein